MSLFYIKKYIYIYIKLYRIPVQTKTEKRISTCVYIFQPHEGALDLFRGCSFPPSPSSFVFAVLIFMSYKVLLAELHQGVSNLDRFTQEM